MRLNSTARIAIYSGDKIGDSLISMVFARNFHESGYETTIFSSRLVDLADLFPGYCIKPSIPEERRKEALAPFDLRLFPAYGDYLKHKDPDQEKSLLFESRKIFRKQRPLSDVFEELSKKVFGLSPTFRDPNIKRPKGSFRKHLKRIAIHPTSSRADKNWQKKKFLQVAAHLKKQGFEPILVLAPFEAAQWESSGIPIASFKTLPEMAAFLYESGFFLGNDSGLGHLASALHLPTLTLCPRRKQGRRWGPAWGPSVILYPWLHLPGRRLKELFWKHFISTKRVISTLERLLAQHS